MNIRNSTDRATSNLERAADYFFEKMQRPESPYALQPAPKSRKRQVVARCFSVVARNPKTLHSRTPSPTEELTKIFETQSTQIDNFKADEEQYSQKKKQCRKSFDDATRCRHRLLRLGEELTRVNRQGSAYHEMRRNYNTLQRQHENLRQERERQLLFIERHKQQRIQLFRECKAMLYQIFLKDALLFEVCKDFLLKAEEVRRKLSKTEQALNIFAYWSTYLDLAVPYLGAGLSAATQTIKLFIEYKKDKATFNKAGEIIRMFGGTAANKSARINSVSTETSEKMGHRFKDHLPYLTADSLQKLSVYNRKQMLSSGNLRASKRKMGDSDWSSSRVAFLLVLGTLLKRKSECILCMDAFPDEWHAVELMRLTRLKNNNSEDLILPRDKRFVRNLYSNGYPVYRYGSHLEAEFEEERETWSLGAIASTSISSFLGERTLSHLDLANSDHEGDSFDAFEIVPFYPDTIQDVAACEHPKQRPSLYRLKKIYIRGKQVINRTIEVFESKILPVAGPIASAVTSNVLPK